MGFNVISAIFVESTMASAEQIAKRKLQARFEDEHRWAVNVSTLIKCLIAKCPSISGAIMADQDKLTDSLDAITELEFPCSALEEIIDDDDKVREALENLDI